MCLSMAILIAFAGIVIFTSLHKHDLRSPAKCSLNNLDAQQTDGPTVVAVPPAPVFIGVHRVEEESVRASEAAPLRLPARAPPTLFS